MSDVIAGAVEALNRKLDGGFDGTAKFIIEGEGTILLDGKGARPADDGEEARVTLRASREVFEALLAGQLDPTSAFMSGKLGIEGDMGQAMKLGGVLA